MKKFFLFIMAVFFSLQGRSQCSPTELTLCLQPFTCPNIPSNPDFSDSMSQETLESYLAKSICMEGLGSMYGDELCHILCKLDVAQPKYIARVGGSWSANQISKLFPSYANVVCKIHNLVDENIICAASIFENIGAHGTLSAPWAYGIGDQTPDHASQGRGKIPQYVRAAFPGYNGSDYWCYTSNPTHPNPPYGQYPGNNTPDPDNLIDYRLMGYDYPGASFYDEPGDGYNWEKVPDSDNPQDSVFKIYSFAPDITKIQTQMWYYWLGTTYIDLGFEALHIGQIGVISDNDPNLIETKKVLKMIRTYASTHARRGLVLINGGRKKGKELNNVFDFVKVNSRIKESPPFRPTNGGGNAIITNESSCSGHYFYCECSAPGADCNNPSTCFDAIYTYPPSGVLPLGDITGTGGISCDPCPYLAEVDHSSALEEDSYPGNREVTEVASNYQFTYGIDEMTWFAEQEIIPGYQEDWVQYAYFKVKCYDKVGYFEMPGMRQVNYGSPQNPDPPGIEEQYEIPEGLYSLYKNIWDATIFPVKGKHYNFTDIVTNNPIPDNVSRSLTLVGDTRMYFINKNNTVQGYLYSPSSGKWHPTSPYWTADGNGYPAASQIPAVDNLVANESGNRLYYRNANSTISIYNMVGSNIWDWTYEEIQIFNSNFKVNNHLTPVGDNKIYYVGADNKIHGYVFDGNQWNFVSSPSGVPLAKSFSNQGGLVADFPRGFLHFIDVNGNLGRLNINALDGSLSSYFQISISHSYLKAKGGLVITEDNHLYYVGEDKSIHGYSFTQPNSYIFESPSVIANSAGHNGLGVQEFVLPNNDLTVSPNGSRIFYVGLDGLIHGYNVAPHNEYSFFDIEEFNADYGAIRDVRAISDDKVFFISNKDFNVHYYQFEEDNCGILPIRVIESCGQVSALSAPNDVDLLDRVDMTQESDNDGSPNLKVFPNPATNQVQITADFIQGSNHVVVTNYTGQLVKEYAWDDEIHSHKTLSVDFSEHPRGIYFCIYLNNGNIIDQEKIVISK